MVSAASTVDGNKAPELVLLLVSSLVELVAALLVAGAAADGVGNTNTQFAQLVGLVSTLIVGGMVLIHFANAAVLDKKLFTLRKVDVSAGLILAVALFCLWFAACGILTIIGPFVETSNGYFASWASLAASLLLMAECAPASAEEIDERAAALKGGQRPYLTLLLPAIVVLLSAANVGDAAGTALVEAGSGGAATTVAVTIASGRWEPVLMIVICALVIVCMAVLILKGDDLAKAFPKLPLAITLLTLVLWSCEVFIGTFRAPFLTTGNGYFASWIGLGAAAYICKPHLPTWLQEKMMRVQKKVADKVMDGDGGGGKPSGDAAAKADGADDKKSGGGGGDGKGGGSSEKAPPSTPASAVIRSATKGGSASAKKTPGGGTSVAEGEVWPLVAALGEQQAKAATLLSALTEQQQRTRELEEELGAMGGGKPSGGGGGGGAASGATIANLQGELAEAYDALNDAEAAAAASAAEAEEAKDALDAMRAERDDAKAQLAKANTALDEARAEIEAEREKAAKRAEAGRAALANRRGKGGGDVEATPARSKSTEGAPGAASTTAKRREDLTDEGFFDGRGDSPDTKDRPPRSKARSSSAAADAEAALERARAGRRSDGGGGRRRTNSPSKTPTAVNDFDA